MKCLVLLFVSVLLTACDWFERDLEWKQEVTLQDGRIVTVDRVSKVTGKRFPEGGNYDAYQSLTFTHPDTGERIAWAPPEHTGPVMLDFDGGNTYVVVQAISSGDYNRIGCPNPPSLVYRYADKQWTQVSINEMPARFEERNIQRRSMDDRAAIADGVVTAAEFYAEWHNYRTRDEDRIISREKANPSALGCFGSVLIQQGRQSEIDYRM